MEYTTKHTHTASVILTDIDDEMVYCKNVLCTQALWFHLADEGTNLHETRQNTGPFIITQLSKLKLLSVSKDITGMEHVAT